MTVGESRLRRLVRGWLGDRVVHGLDAIDAELERFVQATRPYPAWRLALDRQYRASRSLVARAWSRARQSVGGS